MRTKHAIIVGALIVLAIFIALLLIESKPHDLHNDDKADAIATHDTLKAHDAISAKIIDSLKLKEDSLLRENKRLVREQGTTRRQLDLKSAQVTNLAKEIQKHNKDTALDSRINDLVTQVDNLTYLLNQYEQYADSINNVTDSLATTFAAKDAEREKNKAELKAAYQKLYADYLELFDTNKGLMKSLKRQKLKTKIAAILGLAAGAAAVLK